MFILNPMCNKYFKHSKAIQIISFLLMLIIFNKVSMILNSQNNKSNLSNSS